jgi:tight adherence protein C
MGTLVLLVGFVAVLGGALLAVLAMAPPVSARQQVTRGLAALGPRTGGGKPTTASSRERLLVPALEHLAHLGHRLSPSGTAERLQRQLDLAGNPGAWTEQRVLAAKAAALLGAALLASWFCSSAALGGFRTMAVTAIAGAAGFFLPDLLVYNAGTKRQEVMQKGLADALDLLTISVESGLGFDAALVQVARSTDGPLAAEFFRTLQEMQIGKSRMEALRAMGERSTVPDLRTFLNSIVQADTLGIPIARVLREQSKEMRLKRRQRAEEKAMKVPVKVLIPTVIFILPVIFVVILGPAGITISRSL